MTPSRTADRPTVRALLRTLALAAPLLLIACKTVQAPPPAPEPVPEFKPAEITPPPKPPEPPQQFVTITGSKVNLRQGPDTRQPIVATAKKGDRLRTIGNQGEWYELRLDGDKAAFVHAKFVRKEIPCPPDVTNPQVISTPTMDLSETSSHGAIQLRIRVDAKGDVTDVKVELNGTGDKELEAKAIADAKAMKFTPLVRKCKATPFVYMITRSY